MDPILRHARGVEFQGWGGVLLGFAALSALAWILALVFLDPNPWWETWPFLALFVFFLTAGLAIGLRGRQDEALAHEEGDPGMPDD